nr:GNAT family N-acetyltransferase [uncultured Blautia sp.]
MVEYRTLSEPEIDRALFQNFIRRQVVTKCWRREKGKWLIKEVPFIDDWTEEDYKVLIGCLKRTVSTGGVVFGAFADKELKGFAAVLPEIFGGENQYMDLAAIHVSQDMRGSGIGSCLLGKAEEWAKEKGAKKLYISAHSAVESQAFYKKMGCMEAKLYKQEHVEAEPFDCQLEVLL